jgi:hypothetical protein
MITLYDGYYCGVVQKRVGSFRQPFTNNISINSLTIKTIKTYQHQEPTATPLTITYIATPLTMQTYYNPLTKNLYAFNASNHHPLLLQPYYHAGIQQLSHL